MLTATKIALLVPLFLIGCGALAQEQKVQWRWVHAGSLGRAWEVYEGAVDVQIQNGMIRTQLCAVKGIMAPCFDIKGDIKLDKPSAQNKGMETGKVTALVTRQNSDMAPSTFTGSYRRWAYDNTGDEDVEEESEPDKSRQQTLTHTEIITLSNAVAVIGLTRSWTEPK